MMEQTTLIGIVLVISALPGLAMGLLLLAGKWIPPSFQAARDPARARVASARLLMGVDAMLLVIGFMLMLLPREQITPIVAVLVGLTLLVAIALGITAVRANRA